MNRREMRDRRYPRVRPIAILFALIAVWFWVLVRNGGPVLVIVLAAIPVVIVVLVGWRLLMPARATRLLNTITKSRYEKGRFRLRRFSRRGPVWHLAWKAPAGATVTALRCQGEAIEQALNASVQVWFDRGLVHMRAGTARLASELSFEEFYRRPPMLTGELPAGIGASQLGPLWVDLAALPHLLVGGLSGTGKTAFLRQLLAGLVLRLPSERLHLVLLDFKGMEFGLFGRLPHLLAPVARDHGAGLDLLEQVGDELDRRQAMFARTGVETLIDWNRVRPADALPYVLVVVDECAELSAAEVPDREERARRQQALAHLSRVCRLGRASGIHAILSTQRPDADAVPGQIKANLAATVAFRVRNETNSRILLGEGVASAAALPPVAGRGIWQWETETHFQAPWLSPATARRLLEEAYPPVLGSGTAGVTPCPQCPAGRASDGP